MSTINITVKGEGTFSVPEGKRLVLALVDECGIDQLHACGGNCMCTTCAVSFVEGAPTVTTAAEQAKLAERGLSGVRLSCQIQAADGMQVEVLNRLADSGRPDPGSRPSDDIAPEPDWVNF